MKSILSARSKVPNEENGSTTITALIVVGVAAVLIAGMMWRQELQIKTLENSRNRTQVSWLQRAAIDFARLVLVEDQKNSQSDHLGEAWALPLVDSKVADFLKNADVPDEISKVTVIGGLTDAQGLFNLANLWDVDFKSINSAGVKTYARLLETQGLDRNIAQQTAQFFLDRGLSLANVDSLSLLPVYTRSILMQLTPYITILPTHTKINVNTASVEVLMSVLPGLSRSSLEAFVQQRSLNPIKSFDGISSLLDKIGPPQSVVPSMDLMDVKSNFWLVNSEIRMQSGKFINTTLIQRSNTFFPTGDFTRVIWNRSPLMLAE
jgi:general secretion pathway protein K